ncbi:MAG TPA: magnesium transporter [Anaerolineae bacterium]|nr:magnesium transporter [Anaerolineae bacterium]
MSSLPPGSIDETIEAIRDALDRASIDEAIALLDKLRAPDQAEVFTELEPEDQAALLPRMDPDDSADILEHLEDEEAAEVAEQLDPDTLSRIVDEMEPDEAADLLGDLSKERVDQVLARLEDPDEIRPLLIHPDETAGGRMTSDIFALRRRMTVQEAIDALRSLAPGEDVTYYLLVVDRDNILRGVLSLRKLLTADPSATLESIMDPDVISIQAGADQEEAARLISRYSLFALPVVDGAGRLLGLITHDDLVDVIEDEASEDIYRLGGVIDEDRASGPARFSVKHRLPWLYVNTFTAFIAAWVISQFESTIERVAILAAFQAIVAGQGGNAGTQSLTVMVRSIALGDVELRDVWRVLLKEFAVGLTVGVAVGAVVAVIAATLQSNPALGVIIGAAMIGNMIVACLAGAAVPVVLKRLKIDPALGSGVIVTAITDATGFALFLGLATVFIEWLD